MTKFALPLIATLVLAACSNEAEAPKAEAPAKTVTEPSAEDIARAQKEAEEKAAAELEAKRIQAEEDARIKLEAEAKVRAQMEAEQRNSSV